MRFDRRGITRQLDHLLVAERIPGAQFNRGVDGLDRMARLRAVGELHANQLGAQLTTDDRKLAGCQHRLVHIELVRVNCPLNHRLTQPIGAGDQHHIRKTGLGVEGEHHARCAEIASDHPLNARRQSHIGVCKPLVDPIGDRTVVVERGEHMLDAIEHGVDADHIQIRLLLARE